jgi:energy-coupling factor transport system substrate-specific component
MMRAAITRWVIYLTSASIGVIAFLYPFFLPMLPKEAVMGSAHAQDAPLLLTVLVGICFAALLVEAQAQAGSAKMIALLGVLVSINALLRFVEVAAPGPGGFSPIFFLIATTGYVMGGRFGFLMGALTLFVSALITGGVGPWLPYQMFTAGWMGLSAPLCRPAVRVLRGEGTWREVTVLALFAGVWGLVYGAIMNLWFWPYAVGPQEQHWQPGMHWTDGVMRYAAFYLATSLAWDAMRLAGNMLLMFAFALPTLRVLRRFQQRFTFTYRPMEQVGI